MLSSVNCAPSAAPVAATTDAEARATAASAAARAGELQEDGGPARVVSETSTDALAPRRRTRRARVIDVFLPEGYPRSVAPGYGAYQLWDAFQGLTSYVRANLAYKATLEGLGVGDVEASAMAGALANVARDASSSLAGLLLAYGCSRDFGRRVRQWRLAADVADHLNAARGAKTPRALQPKTPRVVSADPAAATTKKRRRAADTSSPRRRDAEGRVEVRVLELSLIHI